jgi:ribonuclease HII
VAVGIGVGEAGHEEIDRVNIAVAGRLSMLRAVEALELQPDYLLIDGFPVPECSLPQEALVKGDRRSCSIMAAGIIAKTTRDAHMKQMAEVYPGYGFEVHFGYSTPAHAEALTRLGPCAIHRRSFSPVAVAQAILSGEVVEPEPAGWFGGRDNTIE